MPVTVLEPREIRTPLEVLYLRRISIELEQPEHARASMRVLHLSKNVSLVGGATSFVQLLKPGKFLASRQAEVGEASLLDEPSKFSVASVEDIEGPVLLNVLVVFHHEQPDLLVKLLDLYCVVALQNLRELVLEKLSCISNITNIGTQIGPIEPRRIVVRVEVALDEFELLGILLLEVQNPIPSSEAGTLAHGLAWIQVEVGKARHTGGRLGVLHNRLGARHVHGSHRRGSDMESLVGVPEV